MTLPKRRKPKPMGCRTPTVVRSKGHLQWVRGHECVLRGSLGYSCSGGIEAAHVRHGGDGGMAMKPGDDRTLPLCAFHHAQQTQIGERRFELWHEIDMVKIAADLWQADIHHRRVWERKLEAMDG